MDVKILPEPSDEEREAIVAALTQDEEETPPDEWSRAGLPQA